MIANNVILPVRETITTKIPDNYKEDFKVYREQTLPANGKAQYKSPTFSIAIREVLIDIDNSVSSSGGITEVIINEWLRISLYLLLLLGSSSPHKKAFLLSKG